MPPRGPFDGGHGHHAFESSLSMLPFLGSLLLLLLLVLIALYLWRQGKPPAQAGGHRSPEDEAKQILAERFARGDISSDEFLSGPAFSTGLPAPSRCRPSLARTAVFDLPYLILGPVGCSSDRHRSSATAWSSVRPTPSEPAAERSAAQSAVPDHAQGAQIMAGCTASRRQRRSADQPR